MRQAADLPDPRLAAAARNLAGIQAVLAVTGGKGGVGKSLVAATLALARSRAGRQVGLLDLDLTAPTAHVVLGSAGGFPREEDGIEPLACHGLRFLSVEPFARAAPIPLRGPEQGEVLRELLAITRWGELDLLVVDMPPGLGDPALDLVRLLPGARFLVVGAASRMVRETVRRCLAFLTDAGVPVAGVVENLARPEAAATGGGESLRRLAGSHRVPWLGTLPFDPAVEAALGDPERLLATAFGEAVAALDARLQTGC